MIGTDVMPTVAFAIFILAGAPAPATDPPPCWQGAATIRDEVLSCERKLAERRLALFADGVQLDDVRWVKRRLALAWDEDQVWQLFMMHAFAERKGAPGFAAAVLYADAREQDVFAADIPLLKDIIAVHGWPKASVFGEDAAKSAFIIAQHADGDRAFQKHALALMTALRKSHEVSDANWAYLYDRVAQGEGRPQRFGTQYECKDGKKVHPRLEDDKRVDELRRGVGLGPLDEYIAHAPGGC